MEPQHGDYADSQFAERDIYLPRGKTSSYDVGKFIVKKKPIAVSVRRESRKVRKDDHIAKPRLIGSAV